LSDAETAPASIKVAAAKGGPWWQQMRSPVFDDWILQGLAANKEFAAARARLEEARENSQAEKSRLFPNIFFRASGGAQNFDGNSTGISQDTNVPGGSTQSVAVRGIAAISPTAIIPIDLFGRIKRSIEEQRAFSDVREFELQEVYVATTANIARQLIGISVSHDAGKYFSEIVAQDLAAVRFTEQAFEAGAATRQQILEARERLSKDQSLTPGAEEDESLARHSLAILLGKAPSDISGPQISLRDFSVPEEISITFPSELVHERPDILAAEASLHMASARVGVATARLYPDIDLSAGFSYQIPFGADVATLGGDHLWSGLLGLAQPIFDGGALNARRRAAIAAYNSALQVYQQVVLNAFKQTADLIQAVRSDSLKLKELSQVSQIRAASVHIVSQSLDAGDVGIVDLLMARRDAANADVQLARARAKLIIDYIDLLSSSSAVPKKALAIE
jgi:NodT family efflux transporter outer membrane factor (OMF) lipoprotein